MNIDDWLQRSIRELLCLHNGLWKQALLCSETTLQAYEALTFGIGTGHGKGDGMEVVLRLIDQAFPHLARSPDKRVLEEIDLHKDTISLALAATTGIQRLDLAVKIWRYWLFRGYFQEGKEWLQIALQDSQNAAIPLRAEALRGLGVLCGRLSLFDEAEQHLQQSLTLWGTTGDQAGQAETLNNLGTLAKAAGRYEDANSFHERSLDHWQKASDDWGVAAALNNLGAVALHVGELGKARNYLEQSADLYRNLDASIQLCSVLNNLGMAVYQEGDIASARAVFEENLTHIRAQGNRMLLAISLHNLGECCYRLADFEAAQNYCEESLRVRQDIDYLSGIWLSVDTLANIALKRQQPERAASLLGVAERLREEIGEKIPPVEQATYDQDVAAICDGLGTLRFAEQFSRGKALSSLDSCLDFILNSRKENQQ